MSVNPYESPQSADQSVSDRPSEKRKRAWLVVIPICWEFGLFFSGIGGDRVSFPVASGVLLTAGTVIALGVLFYAVQGWWRLLTLPLWLLMLMEMSVLWFWNVRSW